MALKFSANISTMFREIPKLEDRFEKAHIMGFNAVEIQQDLYDTEAAVLQSKKQNVNVDLVNIYCETEFGCASIPMKEFEFMRATEKLLSYHFALNFKKVHILSGNSCSTDVCSADYQLQFLISALKNLVDNDYLERINVTAVLEPICSDVNPKYFLNSFEKAIAIIKEINSDQVKLLLDVYHLHKITGNVMDNIVKYYPYAGHVQVSQDPGRHEPFHPDGKIDYKKVFEYLMKENHKDYIGLEYFPSGTTEQSLEWMKSYVQ